jgi:hypothetical protein
MKWARLTVIASCDGGSEGELVGQISRRPELAQCWTDG